jgi:NAD-binding of NADP-dependent 3-hydroxyisobutyrate dehydrogenase
VLSVLRRGDYDESFALALACKDLGLAVGLARQTGVPVEVSAVVEQIYRRAGRITAMTAVRCCRSGCSKTSPRPGSASPHRRSDHARIRR